MSFNEVKNLRQSGKLEEAYKLAKQDLDARPEDVWNKRSIAWVLYDLLKQNVSVESKEIFLRYLKELGNLNLPESENMVFDNVAWQVGKLLFQLRKENDQFSIEGQIYELVKGFHFTKPSEGYSYLFKALHKCFKEQPNYIAFVDWWGLENFMEVDFQSDELPNGKAMMAIAEQAYIAYAKKLLDGFKSDVFSSVYSGDKEKLESFLTKLDALIDAHPDYQYPPYFKAQILLALGTPQNVLSAFLPFAKKKRNDFWVWDLLAEIFADEEEKRIACLCRAMLCRTQEDFLSKLREKMADYFVGKGLYREAKTEINIIVNTKAAHGWKLSSKIQQWQKSQWFATIEAFPNNVNFYKRYSGLADNLLFSDTPEELAVIEFVNTDKKVANFVISQKKHGFFKYDRAFKSLEIGDVLKVRLSHDGDGNLYKILTAEKTRDQPGETILRLFNGNLRKKEEQAFGFVEDIFIEPKMISDSKLTSHSQVSGKALLSYNKKKESWGWKALSIC